MMNNYNKYIKYKNKYIKLNIQNGFGNIDILIIGNKLDIDHIQDIQDIKNKYFKGYHFILHNEDTIDKYDIIICNNQNIETKLDFYIPFFKRKTKENGIIYINDIKEINKIKLVFINLNFNIIIPIQYEKQIINKLNCIVPVSNFNYTWKQKLDSWSNGNYLKYPDIIKQNFYYKTSICNKDMTSICNEIFIETDLFDNIEQDYSSYDKYFIDKSKMVIKTTSHSGNILIIPVPKKGKEYTTIKHFCDNAPEKQQIEFWKLASDTIKEALQTTHKLYINTHGHGVNYFHLRLDKDSTYYSEFKDCFPQDFL